MAASNERVSSDIDTGNDSQSQNDLQLQMDIAEALKLANPQQVSPLNITPITVSESVTDFVKAQHHAMDVQTVSMGDIDKSDDPVPDASASSHFSLLNAAWESKEADMVSTQSTGTKMTVPEMSAPINSEPDVSPATPYLEEAWMGAEEKSESISTPFAKPSPSVRRSARSQTMLLPQSQTNEVTGTNIDVSFPSFYAFSCHSFLHIYYDRIGMQRASKTKYNLTKVSSIGHSSNRREQN